AISVVDAQGIARNCVQSVTAMGAELKQAAEGLQVFPHAADAQLFLPLAGREKFLVAELFVFES
ncbi:MAG: hypothetical protein ABIO94_07040, partial [Opitutaceae bacterium]